MEEALKREKVCSRYRLLMIQEFGLKNLLSMRNYASVLYDKIDDWIEYAYKIENDALEDMAIIFQEYIEQEKKIQTEVRLTNYDVIVSDSI